MLFSSDLEAEADAQDEAGDAGDEAAEEGVEGEGPHQAAVNKLHSNKGSVLEKGFLKTNLTQAYCR